MNVSLLAVIHGWHKAEMLATSLSLGLYETLADGPKTAKEVAAAAKCHEENTFRLLRASAVQGLVDFDAASNKFSLSELSKSLVGPGSWAPVAIHLLSDSTRTAWRHLPAAIKDGKTPFDDAFGMGVFEYYDKHPEDLKKFHGSMTRLSSNAEIFGKLLSQVYPFTSFKKIIDVGGGEGGLMVQILRGAPQATGVVFDLPHVVEGAKRFANDYKDVSDRLSFEGGSFFDSVTAGGDAYVMKVVLHDWNDDSALKIVQSIHKVFPADGKLLIIEYVVSEQNARVSTMLDMQMMVVCGGKERTAEQFTELLDKGGFKLTKVLSLAPSPFCVVEAVKK